MHRRSIAFVLVPVALLGLAAARSPQPGRSGSGEVYYRCQTGFQFETSGEAVHCKKAAYVNKANYAPCAFPTPTTQIDAVGNVDMCAGTGVVGVVSTEPICYAADITLGYTKRHVVGKDYCGKNHPAQIKAPDQTVVL